MPFMLIGPCLARRRWLTAPINFQEAAGHENPGVGCRWWILRAPPRNRHPSVGGGRHPQARAPKPRPSARTARQRHESAPHWRQRQRVLVREAKSSSKACPRYHLAGCSNACFDSFASRNSTSVSHGKAQRPLTRLALMSARADYAAPAPSHFVWLPAVQSLTFITTSR